jgi:hypothetical protein
MAYKYVEVGVDVDLEEFSDEEILDEIKQRNLSYSDNTQELVTSIWLKRRVGGDYQKELDDLIYNIIGKIV